MMLPPRRSISSLSSSGSLHLVGLALYEIRPELGLEFGLHTLSTAQGVSLVARVCFDSGPSNNFRSTYRALLPLY